MLIKTIKKQVEHCLQNYPETRNSDITLMIKVWKEFYGVSDRILTEDLYGLPREDNVKRIRAYFNSKGLYYPTNEKVIRKRCIKENEWRQAINKPNKEEIYYPTKNESYTDKLQTQSNQISQTARLL